MTRLAWHWRALRPLHGLIRLVVLGIALLVLAALPPEVLATVPAAEAPKHQQGGVQGNSDPSTAQPPLLPGSMTNARLGQLLHQFDETVQGEAGYWQLRYEAFEILVITDENANRMRMMIPVAAAGELSKEQLYRLMQANFESALDARYAVAQGLVWSTFIHPLGPLNEEQVFSALAQTITLAATYGNGFTSGALRFGGGDGAGDDIYDGVLKQARPRIEI